MAKLTDDQRRGISEAAFWLTEMGKSTGEVIVLPLTDQVRDRLVLAGFTLIDYLDVTYRIEEQRRKAGSVSSPAKRKAAAENAKKGGRPVTTGAGLRRKDRQK